MNEIIQEKQKRLVLSKNIGLELLEGDMQKLEFINKTARYVYNLLYSYYFLSNQRLQYRSNGYRGRRAKNIREKIAPMLAETEAIWQETGLLAKIDEVLQRDIPKELQTEAFLRPIRNAVMKRFDFDRNGVRFEKYPSSLHTKFVPLFFDVNPENIQSYFSVAGNADVDHSAKKQKNGNKQIELSVFDCSFRVKTSKSGSKAYNILMNMLEKGAEEYRILSSAIQINGKTNIALFLNYEQIGQFTSVSHPDNSIVLGIDLGINYPAYGMIYPNKIGKSFGSKDEYFDKKRQFRKRKEILSQLTHNNTVQEEKLRMAVYNFRTDYNHQLSREIIKYAQEHNVGVIHLEKLYFVPTYKSKNILLRDWDYAQLRDFITYKARQAGIVVKMVDARNTSKKCAEDFSHQNGKPMDLLQVDGKNGKLESIFQCTKPTCKNHFRLIERKDPKKTDRCPECDRPKTLFKLRERLEKGSSKTWYVEVCRNKKVKGADNVFRKCKNYYHFCKRDENAALNIAKAPVRAKQKKQMKRKNKSNS